MQVKSNFKYINLLTTGDNKNFISKREPVGQRRNI